MVIVKVLIIILWYSIIVYTHEYFKKTFQWLRNMCWFTASGFDIIFFEIVGPLISWNFMI